MDDFTVLARDEIVRRLNRMKGEKNVPRLREITLRDVAKWMGISRGCVRGHAAGTFNIGEAHQISYSALFAMMDAGCLAIHLDGHTKTLVRIKPPAEPPKREIRPFIDFTNMRLKVE